MYLNVCRICSQSENTLLNIFEEDGLSDKILSCFGITIRREDDISKKICKPCYILTMSTYAKQLQARQNNATLWENYEKSKKTLDATKKRKLTPKKKSSEIHLSIKKLKLDYPKLKIPKDIQMLNFLPYVKLNAVDSFEKTDNMDKNVSIEKNLSKLSENCFEDNTCTSYHHLIKPNALVSLEKMDNIIKSKGLTTLTNSADLSYKNDMVQLLQNEQSDDSSKFTTINISADDYLSEMTSSEPASIIHTIDSLVNNAESFESATSLPSIESIVNTRTTRTVKVLLNRVRDDLSGKDNAYEFIIPSLPLTNSTVVTLGITSKTLLNHHNVSVMLQNKTVFNSSDENFNSNRSNVYQKTISPVSSNQMINESTSDSRLKMTNNENSDITGKSSNNKSTRNHKKILVKLTFTPKND